MLYSVARTGLLMQLMVVTAQRVEGLGKPQPVSARGARRNRPILLGSAHLKKFDQLRQKASQTRARFVMSRS